MRGGIIERCPPAYTDASVWDSFDPALLTLCSPDPQAIRPAQEKVNVLQVTLPTNFKVARFDDEATTSLLRELAGDIEAVRLKVPEGLIELPVKLKSHDSPFVPLAKWAMLLAGNYRCITSAGMRTAQEAVHTDLAESRSIYNFVNELCIRLGAAATDLVFFEKYRRGRAEPHPSCVRGPCIAKRCRQLRTCRMGSGIRLIFQPALRRSWVVWQATTPAVRVRSRMTTWSTT